MTERPKLGISSPAFGAESNVHHYRASWRDARATGKHEFPLAIKSSGCAIAASILARTVGRVRSTDDSLSHARHHGHAAHHNSATVHLSELRDCAGGQRRGGLALEHTLRPRAGYGSSPDAPARWICPGAGTNGRRGAGALIYTPGPEASLGGVQPPPATFDPYGPPVAAPTPALPADPCYNSPQGPPPQLFTLPPLLAQPYKFVQDISIDYHWFAGSGSTDQLGINDIDVWATFALPMPNEPPLLITPGFAFHFWEGPASTAADGFADMPARTYDAYLDVAWNPVFVPNSFSAELEASIGIYSDFTTLTNQSYRVKGKGLGVIAIPDTNLTLKAGVWYIDRGFIKLLPAGGFVWKPSPVTRFDILFPNPKFTQMFYTQANGTEWWWYLAGEYGGGVWTIKRAFGPDTGSIDLVDYNDIRFALGIELRGMRGATGFFEGGYAFNRQLIYASGEPGTFTPNGTCYLHAGASF